MFVVTGNRLLDGIVVFLAPAVRWDEDLQQARCYEVESDAEAALEEIRNQGVIDLAVISVSRASDDEPLIADRLRERIRADGPTIDPFEGLHLSRKFDRPANRLHA
ncbi:DUF2849 domain-containing protein [Cohaesibacter gelatinilyticus]|uniref:DUF2849 domain-containing protein n=1 Tax=Cohaesibacter gelatinilyticus TaxID=372072 RepID=A0A285NEF4_9HYPH|nr:DUF2849 domain-containing protein [Cohaesibacter gelatinilyticus]SNZ07830.1 Protein of unknown function [Cohaesibacter gelatinilyticus]